MNCLDDRLDRDLAEVAAEVLGEPLRVAARPLRRVARRHRDAVHAFGAERLDRERGDERRVDPAGDADDDLLEAVLAHVVARARARARAASARGRRRNGVERRRDGVRLLVRGADVDRLDRAERAAVLRERAAARVGQPARHDRRRLDVDQHERLLEAGRAREHRSLVVDHERVAVEDQLVLPADGVAERDVRRRVARARAEHLLALAVAQQMERRRGDVHDQLRAGEREIGGGRPRLPHVLADRHADRACRRARRGRGRRPARSSGTRRRRRSSAGSASARSPSPRRPHRRRRRCRGRGRSAACRRRRRSRARSERSPRATPRRRARSRAAAADPPAGSRSPRARGRGRGRRCALFASSSRSRISARLPARSPTTG